MDEGGINPCDCCESKDDCEGCALDHRWSKGKCWNEKCFCNYECGCSLSLDDVCKASTCYKGE